MINCIVQVLKTKYYLPTRVVFDSELILNLLLANLWTGISS